MDSPERLIYPSLAELLDQLAIDQIKEVLDSVNRTSYAGEMRKIEHDLDLIFAEDRVQFDAHLIRLVIALAQINLHIWQTKEIMQNVPARFQQSMKLAHQINGIRNQIKNQIMEATGLRQSSTGKTNLSTDNLEGWVMSVLEPQESSE